MSEAPKKQPESGEPTLAARVGKKAARAAKARSRGTQSGWSGLGMVGLGGWAVAVPGVLGAALGIWLDEHDPGGRSWTLALLTLGLVIGCLNAWHWINKETKEINEESDE